MTQSATQAITDSTYAELIEALASARSQPLWDRYHRITTRQPQSPGPAHLWSWAEMEPLVAQAVRDVSMEDAERRVLLLARADAPESVATLRNLSGGLQTLLPGEVARAHRHTLAALRFVMQGEGGVTTVNGQACPMQEGDLILTPSWTWHEHTHSGTGRMVWFDGLDLPLLHHLDAMFFELAGPGLATVDPLPTRPPAVPSDCAVLLPDSAMLDGTKQGTGFHYSAARAVQALAQSSARADGSKLLRYSDPQSLGPALPTLDCYLLGLGQAQPTPARRSTASAICVVAQGEGTSSIGSATLHWKRNDVFTIPNWQWVTHTAHSSDARLFLMTDRELLAGMGYLREEEATT